MKEWENWQRFRRETRKLRFPLDVSYTGEKSKTNLMLVVVAHDRNDSYSGGGKGITCLISTQTT